MRSSWNDKTGGDPPDFLGWCFNVTAFCRSREEIDLLLSLLGTARKMLPEHSETDAQPFE